MNKRTKKRLRNIDLDITTATLGTEGLLAGESGWNLAHWMADKFNKNFDEYDKAIDAVYNATHIGGSKYHHLIDGQHSIWAAFKAVENVSQDDSWLKEMLEASEHLFRDTMSVSGINPFFSLTKDQFDNIGNLVANIGISKTCLADALTLNGPELLGGSIALVSSLIMAKKSNPETLSKFAGGCLLSSIVSANPMLMPIAAFSMTYAIHESEDKKDAFVKAGKGALVSGSAFLVGNLMGGPIWLGCIAGMLAAVAVNQAIERPEKTFEKANNIIVPASQIFKEINCTISNLRFQNK